MVERRRHGASSGKTPRVPGSLQGWLGQGLRWGRGSSSVPPLPLHSSRQAAIGLLLHDCPLHRVPETLLPAAIFKIPPAQPLSLSPCSECSRVYRSVPTAAATTTPRQAGTQVPGVHRQRWTHSQGVALCPSEPSKAQAPAHSLWPLVLPQSHSHGSSWGQARQLRQGGWAHMCKYPRWISACLPVGFAAQTWLPHLCSEPLPISPIPATPRVGRQLD